MLLDIETLTLRPGFLRAYLDRLRAGIWDLEQETLGAALECFTVDVGVVNRIVRLRSYSTQSDRQARRTRLAGDPQWVEFRRATQEWHPPQTHQLMVPAPFWPIAPTMPGPIGVVDFRIYTVSAGAVDRYLENYRQHGLAVQMAHLGHCFGFFRSLDGPEEQILHMWAYPDAGERARRRARLNADPAWLEFVPPAQRMLLAMENTLLTPLAATLGKAKPGLATA